MDGQRPMNRMAELGFESLAPPQLIASEVPVPNHVAGGLNDEPKPLIALLTRPLGSDSFGNVGGRSDPFQSLSVLVEDRNSSHGDLPVLSARGSKPERRRVKRLLLHRDLPEIEDLFSIVG